MMAAFRRVEYRPVADTNTPKGKALTGVHELLSCLGPINSLNYPKQKNNLQTNSIIPIKAICIQVAFSFMYTCVSRELAIKRRLISQPAGSGWYKQAL
jgi:hypothetical protein